MKFTSFSLRLVGKNLQAFPSSKLHGRSFSYVRGEPSANAASSAFESRTTSACDDSGGMARGYCVYSYCERVTLTRQ
jgi:hypothetical protein